MQINMQCWWPPVLMKHVQEILRGTHWCWCWLAQTQMLRLWEPTIHQLQNSERRLWWGGTTCFCVCTKTQQNVSPTGGGGGVCHHEGKHAACFHQRAQKCKIAEITSKAIQLNTLQFELKFWTSLCFEKQMTPFLSPAVSKTYRSITVAGFIEMEKQSLAICIKCKHGRLKLHSPAEMLVWTTFARKCAILNKIMSGKQKWTA